MADGGQFLTALESAIAPVTIKAKRGSSDSVTITLSDGRTIEVRRSAVKALADDELAAFVASLV